MSAARGSSTPRSASTSPGEREPDSLKTREVVCTWCGRPTAVSRSAQSVVCPHCNKRLVIEDFRTASYVAVRNVVTCGDVFIERRGHVIASVRAVNLTIDGKLTGDVVAAGRVLIRSTAAVQGDIQAAALRVESGATLAGRVRVGNAQGA